MDEHNPSPPRSGWSMGLSGWPFSLANLTAVGLICLMFYQTVHNSQEAAREDRQLFREELRALHRDNAATAAAMRDLVAEIRQLNQGKP